MSEEEETDGGEQVDQGSAGGYQPAGDDEESVVDLAQQPLVVDWTKFIAGLFALVGVGFGLLAILWFDVVEESMWDVGGFDVELGLPPDMLPFMALFVAAFFGVYLARTLSADDKSVFLAAGISTFAGTVVSLILAAFLTSVAIDNLDVDFGDLIVMAIVAGIVVAIVAVGSVWLTRNQAPEDW